MASSMVFGWSFQVQHAGDVFTYFGPGSTSRSLKLSTASKKIAEIMTEEQLEQAFTALDNLQLHHPTEIFVVDKLQVNTVEVDESELRKTAGDQTVKKKKKKPWTGPIKPKRRPPYPPWTEAYCKEKQSAILEELIANEIGEKLPVSTVLDAWLGKVTRVDFAKVMKELEARDMHPLLMEVFYWMQNCKRRLIPKAHVCNMVLGILARAGMIEDAEELFHMIKEKEWDKLRPYNAMISAYYQVGRPTDAWDLYVKMQKEGVVPDEVTYDTLICGSSRFGYKVEKIYLKMKSSSRNLSLRAYNSVLSAFNREGNIDRVEEVVEEIMEQELRPDIFSFNSLISAYSSSRQPEKGYQIFTNMKAAGVVPNLVTYTTVMQMFTRSSMYIEAIRTFEEMVENGFQPDVFTYSLLVNVYGRAGLLCEAVRAFNRLQQEGYKPSLVTYSSLISGFLQQGRIEESTRCFLQMESYGVRGDVHLLNTMMNGFAKAGFLTEAVNLLHRSKSEGVSPNQGSYRIIVEGFLLAGRLEEALAAYSFMVEEGFPDSKLRSRLSRASKQQRHS